MFREDGNNLPLFPTGNKESWKLRTAAALPSILQHDTAKAFVLGITI